MFAIQPVPVGSSGSFVITDVLEELPGCRCRATALNRLVLDVKYVLVALPWAQQDENELTVILPTWMTLLDASSFV